MEDEMATADEMKGAYPIQFEAESDKSRGPKDERSDLQLGLPRFTVELEAGPGVECHRFHLAEIKGWPEVKTEWKLQCVTIFGHKVCTNVPVFYHRTCTLFVFVDVCYPKGGLNDVQTCILGAAMAAAVAAVISGGAAAAPAFKAALEACLLAKGIKWASSITVNAGTASECGPWH
jgi:hypothetical protein